MSPRAKNRVLTISAAVGAIVTVLGLASPTTNALNHHFVTHDTFVVFQQGLALQHQRDSLVGDARLNRIDTSVAAILRWCHRERGCQ